MHSKDGIRTKLQDLELKLKKARKVNAYYLEREDYARKHKQCADNAAQRLIELKYEVECARLVVILYRKNKEFLSFFQDRLKMLQSTNDRKMKTADGIVKVSDLIDQCKAVIARTENEIECAEYYLSKADITTRAKEKVNR